jgi:hypothetical protein
MVWKSGMGIADDGKPHYLTYPPSEAILDGIRDRVASARAESRSLQDLN